MARMKILVCSKRKMKGVTDVASEEMTDVSPPTFPSSNVEAVLNNGHGHLYGGHHRYGSVVAKYTRHSLGFYKHGSMLRARWRYGDGTLHPHYLSIMRCSSGSVGNGVKMSDWTPKERRICLPVVGRRTAWRSGDPGLCLISVSTREEQNSNGDISLLVMAEAAARRKVSRRKPGVSAVMA